ncbi:MAG: HNH endonuclease [Candidatus Promineifilaceae bacterium]
MSLVRSKAETRRLVQARARGCCEYCYSQAAFSPSSFAIEHIYPQSLGGDLSLDNLAFACSGCNSAKYNKTKGSDPLTGRVVPFYHPRRDKWGEHFSWDEAGIHIIGTSSTGRLTIETLRLNRQNVLNLREILVGVGKHPPVPVDD